MGKMDSPQLKALAQAFKSAQRLSELDLSSNHFGPLAVDTIAKALCECAQLRTLNLSYNEPGDRFARWPVLSSK